MGRPTSGFWPAVGWPSFQALGTPFAEPTDRVLVRTRSNSSGPVMLFGARRLCPCPPREAALPRELPNDAHGNCFVNGKVWQAIRCGAKDGALMDCVR